MNSFPNTDVSTREQRLVTDHPDFRGRSYYEHPDGDPALRAKHEGQPRYELSEQIADLGDQKSLDRSFTCEPREHFEPMVLRVFARAKSL